MTIFRMGMVGSEKSLASRLMVADVQAAEFWLLDKYLETQIRRE